MLTHAPPKRLISTRAVPSAMAAVIPAPSSAGAAGCNPAARSDINNRHYWDEAALDRHDRERVADRAKQIEI